MKDAPEILSDQSDLLFLYLAFLVQELPIPRSKPGSTKFVDDHERRASYIRKLIKIRQSFGDDALQQIH